jgi:hypothetical protein
VSEFEFIFALFGLLLGLSIAEVLGGLARAIEARLRPNSTVRFGVLTPLLGAFVMLDLLSFWLAAWATRETVTMSAVGLLAITIFASAYYVAAHLVFPRDVETQPHFDTHFFRVRRVVVGIMLALLVMQMAWYASVPTIAAWLFQPFSAGMTLVLAALMIAAIGVRDQRWCRWIMAALVARYLVLYLIR